MKIITGSGAFLDIDAYAGILAYAELCDVLGAKAAPICPSPQNYSISKTILSWPVMPLGDTSQLATDDKFCLIDTSDPNVLCDFVDIERVEEVIDHRLEFQQYWLERIGAKAHIELVGAACTLIFERWQKANMLPKISQTAARLLMCGILDNTLNFGAHVTTQRDVFAYEQLSKIANLPPTWSAMYFKEVGESILANPSGSILDDTKKMLIKTYHSPIDIGQLTLWDGGKLLSLHKSQIKQTMIQRYENWFINVLSIGENKSYFVADNVQIKRCLERLLAVKFVGDMAIADRLWLRKEIVQHHSANRK